MVLVLVPRLVSSLPLQLSETAALPKQVHFESVLGSVPKTQGGSRIIAVSEETGCSVLAATWAD